MLELYYSLSCSTRGVLLLGPSGCGKSTLLRLLSWTLNLLHQSPNADARSHAAAGAGSGSQAHAGGSVISRQTQHSTMRLTQQRSRFSEHFGRSPASANVSPAHVRPESISKFSVSSFDTSHSTSESVRAPSSPIGSFEFEFEFEFE